MEQVKIDDKTLQELAGIAQQIQTLQMVQNAILTSYARANGLEDGKYQFDGKALIVIPDSPMEKKED